MIGTWVSGMYHVSALKIISLAVFVFERLTFQELKDQIVAKMLVKLPRLRQRVEPCLGDHYLVDMGVFEASQQISLAEEDLKDEDDICGFLDRYLPERLDPNRPL